MHLISTHNLYIRAPAHSICTHATYVSKTSIYIRFKLDWLGFQHDFLPIEWPLSSIRQLLVAPNMWVPLTALLYITCMLVITMVHKCCSWVGLFNYSPLLTAGIVLAGALEARPQVNAPVEDILHVLSSKWQTLSLSLIITHILHNCDSLRVPCLIHWESFCFPFYLSAGVINLMDYPGAWGRSCVSNLKSKQNSRCEILDNYQD